MNTKRFQVDIYTDGACSGNPGPGGWAAVLLVGKSKKEISGYHPNTTNNRMELQAVIEGLKQLKEACVVHLYSDSSYVINAFEKNWLSAWKRNDWKNASKKDVSNKEQWQELDALCQRHEVHWHKVKGHSDNQWNNRCDELAVAAYKQQQTALPSMPKEIFVQQDVIRPETSSQGTSGERRGQAGTGVQSSQAQTTGTSALPASLFVPSASQASVTLAGEPEAGETEAELEATNFMRDPQILQWLQEEAALSKGTQPGGQGLFSKTGEQFEVSASARSTGAHIGHHTEPQAGSITAASTATTVAATPADNTSIAECSAPLDIPQERTISRDWKFKGRIIQVEVQQVELGPGERASRELVHHSGGVCALAKLPDGRLLFVRQYRKAYEQLLWELPAGKLEKGEDPLAAIQRELREETGYEAKSWRFLGPCYPSPGYLDEVIWLYQAEDLHFVGQELDPGEYLRVQALTSEEIAALIARQELRDAKSLAALFLASAHERSEK